MQSMSLFGENNKSDDKAMQAISELGIEFYGNPKIVKAFLEFYNRGMIHSNSEAYVAYRDAIISYGDSAYRAIISGNVIEPIDSFLNTKPSNEDLKAFIMIAPETKKFILSCSDIQFDYAELATLEKCGFFSSFSNAACLLLLNHYSYSELTDRVYTKRSDSLDILLHSMEHFNDTYDLNLLLDVSAQISVEQAMLIDVINYTGLTIEYLQAKFKDWERFLGAIDVAIKFYNPDDEKIAEKITFLVRYLYNVYTLEELQSKTTMPYLTYWFSLGLFKKVLVDSRCTQQLKMVIKSILVSNYNFVSYEFVINGSTKYLVPLDAGIDNTFVEEITQEILRHSNYITYYCVGTINKEKLVIHLDDIQKYSNGERGFTDAFTVDSLNTDDIYDTNDFMDIFYCEFGKQSTLIDCAVMSYIHKNFSDWQRVENLYRSLVLQERYYVYLAIIASENGNSDFKSILARDDMGIQFLKILGLFIRPDDSFCSAVLRFHFAFLKIPFNKYNKVFNVKSNIINVGNEEVNLLALFSGDKSGITSMQRFSPDELIKIVGDAL